MTWYPNIEFHEMKLTTTKQTIIESEEVEWGRNKNSTRITTLSSISSSTIKEELDESILQYIQIEMEECNSSTKQDSVDKVVKSKSSTSTSSTLKKSTRKTSVLSEEIVETSSDGNEDIVTKTRTQV